jgi:hypothetical protein
MKTQNQKKKAKRSQRPQTKPLKIERRNKERRKNYEQERGGERGRKGKAREVGVG